MSIRSAPLLSTSLDMHTDGPASDVHTSKPLASTGEEGEWRNDCVLLKATTQVGSTAQTDKAQTAAL